MPLPTVGGLYFSTLESTGPRFEGTAIQAFYGPVAESMYICVQGHQNGIGIMPVFSPCRSRRSGALRSFKWRSTESYPQSPVFETAYSGTFLIQSCSRYPERLKRTDLTSG